MWKSFALELHGEWSKFAADTTMPLPRNLMSAKECNVTPSFMTRFVEQSRYPAGPAKRIRFSSGSDITKVLAPQGSLFSTWWNETPAA